MSQAASDAGVLESAPMYSPSEHFSPGLKILSNDPLTREKPRPKPQGNVSDESSAYTTSGSDRSKEGSVDDSHTAPKFQARPAQKEVVPLPHEATRSSDNREPLMMSWWPDSAFEKLWPDSENISNAESFPSHEVVPNGNPDNQHEAKEKHESLVAKLENGISRLFLGAHGHGAAVPRLSSSTSGAEAHTATSKESNPVMQPSTESESLFHVVLTSSHFKTDVNSDVQAVRVCGTYTSLPAAKSFAHRCLFDAGYEQEWFTDFRTQHGGELLDHKNGAIVRATGPGGEVFTVNIDTNSNLFALKANDAGRIDSPLYHVVRTIVHYYDDESGQTRETDIQASFISYDEARKFALSSLINEEDGVGKDSYPEYEEAGPGELDCGYGENVVVHAVGQNGENFLVSVLKSQEMESTRVMEAAMRMR